MKNALLNNLDYLVAILLGGLGGTIRTITAKRKGEKYSVLIAVPEIAIAAFAGLLINALLTKWGIDTDTKIVVISIAGFAAREVLEMLRGFGLGIITALVKHHQKRIEENEK